MTDIKKALIECIKQFDLNGLPMNKKKEVKEILTELNHKRVSLPLSLNGMNQAEQASYFLLKKFIPSIFNESLSASNVANVNRFAESIGLDDQSKTRHPGAFPSK